LFILALAGCPKPAPPADPPPPSVDEPRARLEQIGHGAMFAFLKSSSFPMTPAPATPSRSCCAQNHGGRGACAPDAAAWATDAWQALDFAIDGAHHFQYAYAPTAPDDFTATAIGDLDCDRKPIVYTMRGVAIAGKVHLELTEPLASD
jgi:hypothetical protein